MPDHLTPRETELMDLLAAHPGSSNKELAHRLGIGERAVNKLLGSVFVKYGAVNRTQAYAIHQAATPSRRRRKAAQPDGQMELA